LVLPVRHPGARDWIGEFTLPPIVQAAKRGPGSPSLADARLPGCLRRKQHEIPLRPEEVLA
jgi:hypothetical protein